MKKLIFLIAFLFSTQSFAGQYVFVTSVVLMADTGKIELTENNPVRIGYIYPATEYEDCENRLQHTYKIHRNLMKYYKNNPDKKKLRDSALSVKFKMTNRVQEPEKYLEIISRKEKQYMYCKKVIDETDIQKMIDDVKKSSEK